MQIVFFYPSHVVGGAEFLIIRLVEQLSSSCECFIVDFEDGIYNKLNSKLEDNTFIKFEQNFNIPKNAYIVTYPSEIKKLSDSLNPHNKSNKIIFWAVHGDNFQNLIPMKSYLPNFILKKYFYPFISKTINILKNNNSLITMDGGILERYKNLYELDIQLPFCPIPVNIENNELYKIDEDTTKIKCIWLGRISSEKVYSLLKILEDINVSKDSNIVFDIIGSGDCEDLIRSFIPNSHLTINFLGTITERLDEILINYDVCFAMGTSILESAKLNIPSILVDASYNALPLDYKYRWIFDSKDYILGYLLPNENIKNNSLTMFDILYLMQDVDKKHTIGNKCYKYVKEHHLLEIISNKLVSYIFQSTLTVEDVRKLKVNNTVFHKIHKILKFLKGKLQK